VSQGVGAGSSQQSARAANSSIRDKNLWGGVEVGAAGVAAAAGLVLLLWPDARTNVDAGASASSAWVSVHGTF
jgi:hypothetical protein